MEVQQNATTVKRPVQMLTPKALIHKKYGTKACYTIEEVQQSVDSACPGLIMSQQSRSLYKCSLVLPEVSVTSDTFTRKKDAEQAAAKMAIEKLAIQPTENDLTPQEAFNELVVRLCILFSDEFLSSSHPLVGHFRMAQRKVKDLYSMVPLSVIAACDVKVNSLCRTIDSMAESDPLRVSLFIWKAAILCNSVFTTADGGFWLRKLDPYSPEALKLLTSRLLCPMDTVQTEVIRIPCSTDEHVETLTLDLSGDHYYMDEIAKKLAVRDASQILVSRTVGKASSELKLYFSTPEIAIIASDSSGDLLSNLEQNVNLGQMVNKRASYLTGQCIYGDAVLANVGYTWKSSELFYEDVTLSTYYRLVLAKLPDGHYKLSREAILAAELPTIFTARSNWKGPLPKDLLCVFCRQHRLLEPIFSVENASENPPVEVHKKFKPNGHMSAAPGQALDKPSTYKCEVKVLSKRHSLLLEYSSDNSYKKEFDAIQNAALKVLTWLNKYFKQLHIPVEKFSSFALTENIIIYPLSFSQEFATLLSIYGARQSYYLNKCTSPESLNVNHPYLRQENEAILFNVEGEDSGVYPSPGCVTCISYAVKLGRKGEPIFILIESKDEFEFEMGAFSVSNQLEACVTQLSVNQAAQFVLALPSKDLLFAAAGEYTDNLMKLPLSNCFLEYSVKVLRVMAPLEDRMEQALFSPPLSKQRVEFAVRHINESRSTSLVDFGCGSGSLLDSLLEHSTTLEKIVGVDISRKGLTRAAKIIHSKLSENSVLQESIRSVVLYDGSITDFDSRLYGFDVGTCLEVIEHMEEDQACLFGDVVLSRFCPRILIVSTPNYEYNPILQKSTITNKEDDTDDKSTTCKFRNHDHKFEWTRRQFEQWANDLAARHSYSVEYSGVGGSGDVEPGFASQIAVFRSNQKEKKYLRDDEAVHLYDIIWEWEQNIMLKLQPVTETNFSSPSL